MGEDEHFLTPVLDGSEQEDHLNQLPTVVKDDILVREVQQEAGSDTLKLPRNYCFHLVA